MILLTTNASLLARVYADAIAAGYPELAEGYYYRRSPRQNGGPVFISFFLEGRVAQEHDTRRLMPGSR